VIDKYTEYDNVIICLDALLHKSQAYRHLLFNVRILVSFLCVFLTPVYEYAVDSVTISCNLFWFYILVFLSFSAFYFDVVKHTVKL